MEVIGYLDLFLGALLNVLFYCIIIKKVFKLKFNKNKLEIIAFVVLIALGLSVINIFNKNTFKAIFAIPLIAILVYIIFDVKMSKSIYFTLISSFYLLIGEVIVSFVVSILNMNSSFITENILGKTMGNILVITATMPFLYIKFLSEIFNKISTKIKNDRNIIVIFILFLTVGSAFVFNGIMNIESIITNIVNFIIFSVFAISLCTSFIKTEKVNKISDEYNALLNYLDNYEKEMVEKRKLIHDFKNQLIVIMSYTDNKEKLKEYLNGIIEEQKNIKETKIIKNIDKLPNGLKGLIYYKLSQIDNKINVVLNVKSKFDGFKNLNAKDNKNILKIIGILIDNAIESSIETNEKYLSIEVSMIDGLFKMEIVNSTSSNLEKLKIMENGFTTKGKNRGYGLSLVKDIIRIDSRYKLDFDAFDNEVKTYFEMQIK